MSVRRSDYVLIGVKFESGFFDDDCYDDNERGKFFNNRKIGEIVYLVDEYSDNYEIIGLILQCDKRREDGLNLMEFDSISDYQEEVKTLTSHIKCNFILDSEPVAKIMVLTDWS